MHNRLKAKTKAYNKAISAPYVAEWLHIVSCWPLQLHPPFRSYMTFTTFIPFYLVCSGARS